MTTGERGPRLALVSVDEIKAALLHATAYCGIPAGLDAFRAAHEVLVAEGVLARKQALKNRRYCHIPLSAHWGERVPEA